MSVDVHNCDDLDDAVVEAETRDDNDVNHHEPEMNQVLRGAGAGPARPSPCRRGR